MEITLPKAPKIKEQSENRAVFVIEDLYPGYGVTLGNSLRRTLYSSLPGAAITQVKIKGTTHEFSVLPGVLEDILEITLNLKQIHIKLHSEEMQTATIKVKGVREVKAGDMEVPSQVEVINKDAHIATLTSKDAVFDLELTIEAGLGYVAVEHQKKERIEIGSIPLDAIYTPVVKVNFEVENMRVGDRTDYNRLILEVVTNGTISPVEALRYSSNLLVKHFEVSGDIAEEAKPKKLESAKKEKKVKSEKKKSGATKKTNKK
ncbi:MAG: DNA-directed RNA polymerase subunit alpha [Candidatus Spechtbacteria bacterium RIFCSPHIGHO2_02_FULL_43_15b]|uniref:DNA-directed RNA polymerase subunit alpha n=1 Tax=Candidatus Spechtbacteria bacterium RIFCSPHIGHO2_01_FULL_43_30 TaxID=1802158 RepID=A0A1G2H6Z8_9BACT|nr:MAG: DNA-directed RNA polymerase subunit alpha [Candidatus Spechtbacteria bacterium RIFCSPHIGHO2_01_FULL_43_30]OGZ59406.1 MAG: DNA-directed RNA polymerase subunit alpha [Candidatus Spechtbacteria bacterium RIFCSPHIGHO2_02_FULL_43_15b]